MLASLGICAACCLLPAVLIGLGGASSFVGTLDSLSPYKWYLVVATAVLLGYGFFIVYFKPRKTSAAGATCASCRPGRSVRVALCSALSLRLAASPMDIWSRG
jgi:mercuric ion transport protein